MAVATPAMLPVPTVDDKAALKAFESALEVNPHMPHARQRVKELRTKIKGKRI